ncbi:hypothetical protein KBB96_03225 [Luteolibacter ambystomatis]|uniref:DUF4175 domain-containing protein n=1 Tax=Luteolibacter ambystomatis TaxID=2824561 RepID=A0A975J0R9_9BACT|nr:DUF4175 family protein [Luteolibacter ambystomatis]QUE51906.1 hypothetical protein KBB96_03225 [Luteolibacter ambystomatis]
MSASPPSNDPAPPRLPASLAGLLDRIRGRHLAVAVAEFPVWLLAGLSLAWLAQGGVDRWLNLSWTVRCVLLALDVVGACWLLYRYALKPWLKRLNREGAALLVEREVPDFRSALISAVEFASPQSDAPPQSAALVRHLIDEVTEKAKSPGLVERVVHTTRLKTAFKWMAAPLVIALGVLLACQPVSWLVVKRILLSHEAFPPDTRAFAVSGDLEIDEGGDVALSAKAEGVVPPEGRLVITHGDDRTESLAVSAGANGSAEFSQVVKNVRAPFHYHFEINDGRSEDHAVKVNYPPSVKDLRFVQVYPPYTRLPETVMPPGGLKLLEGSTLRIEGTTSKEVRSGTVTVKGGEVTDLTLVDPEKTAFRNAMVVPGSGWKSLSLHLVGRDGDGSVQDPVYPVELLRDRPPSVAMTLPQKEFITAVATATIPVAFEAVDDFALNYVALNYRVMHGDQSSESPTANGRIPVEIPNGSAELKRRINWNLGRIIPSPAAGDSIVFWIEAVDNNGVNGIQTSRSTEHTVLIVTEEQKRQELLEQIARKAEDIERLYDQQRAINVRTENSAR